ncbi:hypothetical protein PMAYCL1PPCAC_20296, partial [Pristionchus mayeri]
TTSSSLWHIWVKISAVWVIVAWSGMDTLQEHSEQIKKWLPGESEIEHQKRMRNDAWPLFYIFQLIIAHWCHSASKRSDQMEQIKPLPMDIRTVLVIVENIGVQML